MSASCVITWDAQEPDKFKNKVVKYVLFFLNDKDGYDVNSRSEDKDLIAQKHKNQMFAIEVDATKEGAPKEIVDLNDPAGWFLVVGCAVYSNGEWKCTPVRAKEGTWAGPKETDYAKNAIMLPENYEWK